MSLGVQKAFLWSAMERFGQQFIQFGISVVLARLLSPAEYGLIGMLTIFFALAGVFADAGLSMGLIQRREVSPDEETSVFFLNIFAATALMLLLCAISPLVAAFYRQPALKLLLCVSSLQLFISSFAIVQYALLTRAVDFKTQAVISMTATLVSGGIGITMAWRGLGVWSLVGQGLSRNLVNVVLVWVMRSWRPLGRFRWACIRALWPFSSRLLASGLLNTGFENMYSLIIGRLYRPLDLGYFTRAAGLAQLPAGSLQSVIGRVMLPVLARMQDDKERLKTNFRKAIQTLASFHFPAMAGLAAVAGPLVKCLMTGKWAPCVPYLQVLCFSGMLYPLHALHLDVLTAQGRTDLFFRLEIIKKVLTVIVIIATFRISVMSMVWGMLLLSVLSGIVNSYYTRKLIGYAWSEQLGDLLPILAASLMMGAAVWSLGGLKITNDWLLLAVQIATGTALYAAFAFFGRRGAYANAFNAGAQIWRALVPSAIE